MPQLTLGIRLARPRRPEPAWQPGIPLYPLPEREQDPGEPPSWEHGAMRWTPEPIEPPCEVGRTLLAYTKAL